MIGRTGHVSRRPASGTHPKHNPRVTRWTCPSGQSRGPVKGRRNAGAPRAPRRAPRRAPGSPFRAVRARKPCPPCFSYPQNAACDRSPFSDRANSLESPVFSCQVVDSIDEISGDAAQRHPRVYLSRRGRQGGRPFFSHKVIHRRRAAVHTDKSSTYRWVLQWRIGTWR